jgi:hypothetical protein
VLEEKSPAIHGVHHKAIYHVSETRNSYNHSHLNNSAINLIKNNRSNSPACDRRCHVSTPSVATAQSTNILFVLVKTYLKQKRKTGFSI